MKTTFLWCLFGVVTVGLAACGREEAQPCLSITSITPGTTMLGGSALNAAVIGDTLAIQGQNFSSTAADNRVSIGAATVPVLAATPVLVTVVLPPGTPLSYVEVKVERRGYVSAVSPISVRSRPSPVITGIRPLRGPAGTVVTIRGRHLTETYQNNSIAFPNAQGQEGGLFIRPFQPLVATADSIQVVVPVGAGTGRILLFARADETSQQASLSLATPVFTVTP